MKSTHKNHNDEKENLSNDNIWKCNWNNSQIRGVLSYPNYDNDAAAFPYIQNKRCSLQPGKMRGKKGLIAVQGKVKKMRNNKNIFITEYDFGKLNEMIDKIRKENSKDIGFIDKLRNEMNRAKIVSPAKIEGNVVTMNSRVLLKDLDTHHEFSCQVVFPSDADLETYKISVLAPVGTALLGYKVGDVITWEVPGGVRKLKIKEMLYQPESEGDLYS